MRQLSLRYYVIRSEDFYPVLWIQIRTFLEIQNPDPSIKQK